jgi:murein DD-endopeptidase MepM/ murein hydrolase activator NlpD
MYLNSNFKTMENSLDHSNEFLNPQQPLKVDDKQSLIPSILAINPVDSTPQSSGSGLSYGDREMLDKWASKQAIYLTQGINIPIVSINSSKSPGINVVYAPDLKKYHLAPAASIAIAPIVVKKPADIAPTGLVVNGVKSSYDVGSTLSIDPSFVVDGDGFQDISKVDFWLTDAKNKKIELADATSFVAKDPKDKNSAKFSYITSLKGIAVGDYKLNAIASDKFGAVSNQFSQLIAIKPINIAPQTPVIMGVKSIYENYSILSIDPNSYVSDSNGWQDVSKVDFWLTDAQGKRIELDDATSFTSNPNGFAKFNYSMVIKGYAVGNYKLNAITYDKIGASSNLFTQALTIKPPNFVPLTPIVTGIKSSYEANSILSIDNGLVTDYNGWQDVSKVDFWLTNSQGQRVELADANNFTINGVDSAKFSYATNLTGIAAGEYKLNAVASDKAGLSSNPFMKSLTIKPANIAPQAPVITGIKSSYEDNSTLSIDSGSISDGNGWQDISKVSFSLTDATGKITELTDTNTFSSQDVNSAKFSYTANLTGFSAGNYQFKAIAYDKAGIASNPFTQSFAIKSANLAPQAPVITGVKSSYDVNSTLLIDSGSVSDGNGWQDVSKVDFWLTDAKGKRIELTDVTNFTPVINTVAKFGITSKSNIADTAKFSYAVSLKGIAAGDYKLNAVTFDKSGAMSNPFTQSLNIKYAKFKEPVEINTQWVGTVFSWDIDQGKPPVNFFKEGYNSPNAIAELNLGSNDLGNGKQGINFNVGQGALKDNSLLPVDGFAVRAYTQASFDGSEYKFQVRGDDGFQIFAKNIVTNQWIYITPQDQWQSAYGSHQEITKTLPQGRYDLHFHYFEGGGDAYFNLAWDKVNNVKEPPLFDNPTAQNPLKGFINPLNGAGVVSQENGGSYSHTGKAQYAIDFAVDLGTSVYSMRSGRVISMEDRYPDSGGDASKSNMVNYVLIEHDGGYRSAYLHLQQNFKNKVNLKVGDTVNAGQLIGYSGNSGYSTGPHLHVEVHKPTNNVYFGQTVPFLISDKSIVNGNTDSFYVSDFLGTVTSPEGINIRSGPGTNYSRVGLLNNGASLSFNGLAHGTQVYDQKTGQNNDRWFRIKGTDTWVASALINGNSVQSNSNPGNQLPPFTGTNSLVADATHSAGQILARVDTVWQTKSIGVGAVDAGRNINAVLAAIRAFENGGQYGSNGGSTPGDTGASFSLGAYQEGYAQDYIPIGNQVMGTNVTFAQFKQGDPLAQDIAAIGRLSGYGLINLIKNANIFDENQRFNIAEKVVNAWGSWFSDRDSTHSTSDDKYNYKLAHSQAILAALNV